MCCKCEKACVKVVAQAVFTHKNVESRRFSAESGKIDVAAGHESAKGVLGDLILFDIF